MQDKGGDAPRDGGDRSNEDAGEARMLPEDEGRCRADTFKAASSKVNSSFPTPEELVHLVDVSITSKYGADLAQLTRVLAEDVRSTIDSFKHDLHDNLPRQIRSVLKDVVGESQGKQPIDITSTPAL
jgi:hypothetical protein